MDRRIILLQETERKKAPEKGRGALWGFDSDSDAEEL